MMKKYMVFKIIFVACLGLMFVAGCAEKKSVVTGDAQQQGTTSAPATDIGQQGASASQAAADRQKDAGESVDLEKMAGEKSPVSDIHFDFDSSSIRPDARDILKVNADYFMRHRISSIVIEGHCDEKGTNEYNMALGERRARETKRYLVNLGIKESLIQTVSFGEERPLSAESSEEAWAKNRRAHFAVSP